MKKILGLDLGVASIGWALIDEEDKHILGMGSRIIPLSTDDKDEFSRGNAISKNQKRTTKRTQRKGYDRYQLRRSYLIKELKKWKMLPGQELIGLNKIDLWKLRNDGIKRKLTLAEIGRVLLHLNQKRGYKSSRNEANLDKKDTEYVQTVKNRYEEIKSMGKTIGEFFYEKLCVDNNYRTKDKVLPREAYIEEFNTIINNQRQYYPETITDDFIKRIRDEIIYYQRKLKSQKGLVSICEFEGFWTKIKIDEKEKELFIGPNVAPRSSPLFQVCRIWETINNIKLKTKRGELVDISIEKKRELFEFLDNNERITFKEVLNILGLKRDEVYGNKLLVNGLQGNITKTAIMKCFDNLEDFKHLFQFDLNILELNEEVYLIDKTSGEVIGTKSKKNISPEIENQPFYKLWHIIYSVSDKIECQNALSKKFDIPEETAIRLASLDFTKQAFSNKSFRAIRKILPYLMEGNNEYNSRCYAGYYHTISNTKQENFQRKLADRLQPIQKNSLRQPIVEKILNQMINLVNAIIDKYGKPDEIRIELARELKQSKDERNFTSKMINERERENKKIALSLSEYGLKATRNNIIKWRLYHEIFNDDKKQNAICIYCGQPISLTAAILGEEVEVEHIIPKSRLFDDSQSNKTLAHRKCNADKKDQTAYDFMKLKSEQEFNDFIERINILYKNKIISKSKRDKLLTPGNKIPIDFIDRQIRETQYISRKAREILQSICYNVWVTTGSITAELRHIWGWDDILMNLQVPKYRELGLTEVLEIQNGETTIKKETISGWSKRDDNRHHAIDALTIACTKQGFIQRFNSLNSSSTRNDMRRDIESARIEFDKNKSLLDNYILSVRPFKTNEVTKIVENILVSYKPGKKVASEGVRKIKKDRKKIIVQTGIIIPRGPLSEESVYGKIKTTEIKPVKYLFENPHLIFKDSIKKLVEERLNQFDKDTKKAIASLKKDPVIIDESRNNILEWGTCYKDEIVIKYPLGAGQGMLFDGKEDEKKVLKILDSIVDSAIRERIKERLYDKDGSFIKTKDAFQDLVNNPVWFNKDKRIPIKTVRCYTGLTAVEVVKRDEFGKEIGFVKPGNNHHLAIYYDKDGNKQLHICSFWHAVERKKYGIPVIIKNPTEIIDKILDEEEDKYAECFLLKLPDRTWTFIESFQQNEMFLLGLSPEDYEKPKIFSNKALLSKFLYRVQKIFFNGKQLEIYFRHHLETKLIDDNNAKASKRFIAVKSLRSLEELFPRKIIINYLGIPINIK